MSNYLDKKYALDLLILPSKYLKYLWHKKWNLFVGHKKSQVNKKKDLPSEKQDLFPTKSDEKSLLRKKGFT